MKKINIVAAALSVLLTSAASYAAPITFASFSDKTASKFVFTNNLATGAAASASFSSLANAINFNFTSVAGMDAALQGVQNAHLTYSVSKTTTQASQYFGLFDFQPMTSATTLSIVRDTAYKTFTNLLTVTFSGGTTGLFFSGNNLGNSLTESAGTGSGQNVTFTSDFLTFNSSTTAKDMALAFSGLSSPLTINGNGFLNSFTATGSGNFSADPLPVTMTMTVPEPGTYATLLAGLGLMGFALRRRKTL